MAAVGEIKPRAAAGHQRAEGGAEAAQPFEPNRAIRRQPVCELRDLTAM